MDLAPVVQWRVIYALMMREVHTIYGTSRLGYLWALLHTMWNIAVFWAIRAAAGFSAPHGMHVLMFLLIGFGAFHAFSKSISKCMSAVSSNKALLTFPQVTPIDLMISRVILVWCTELTSGLFFVFIGLLCGMPVYLNSVGGLLAFLLLTPLLGLGMGMVCASLTVLYPTLEHIVPMVLRIMFFTSGLFFSATSIPSNVLKYLLYNPMLQIIEWGRYCLSRGYPVLNYSLSYLIVITAGSLCLGLLFERYVRRRQRR